MASVQVCTQESSRSRRGVWLDLPPPITNGLAWAVDLPSKPWERLHPGKDQTSSVSHPETREEAREDRSFGAGEPVYIVHWFSETVVQTAYLPFKATPTEEAWELRPHYLLSPGETEALGG